MIPTPSRRQGQARCWAFGSFLSTKRAEGLLEPSVLGLAPALCMPTIYLRCSQDWPQQSEPLPWLFIETMRSEHLTQPWSAAVCSWCVKIYTFSRAETNLLKAGQSLPQAAHVEHHGSQQSWGHNLELFRTSASCKQVPQQRSSRPGELCKVSATVEHSSQENERVWEKQHFPYILYHKKIHSTKEGCCKTAGAPWPGFDRRLPLPWTWAIHAACLHASSTAKLGRHWISRL